MSVRLRDEGDLRVHESEPGAAINVGADHILLWMADPPELRRSFLRFETRVRAELLRLMLMPAEEVTKHYGQLNQKQGRRGDLEYGLAYFGESPGKFLMLRESAVVRAVFAAGMAPPGASIGPPKARQRIRGVGGVADYVASFDESDRRRVIAATFDEHDDLDDFLRVGQANLVGMGDLKTAVLDCRDAGAFLEDLSKRADRFVHEDKTTAGKASGTGRVFAWAWFAQHLAVEGLWLQPITHISGIRQLFPSLFLPVGLRMAVPARRAGLAEAVLSVRKAARGKSLEHIATTFLAISGSSNLWGGDDLAVHPLVAFKEWSQHHGGQAHLHSHVANALYEMSCREYDVRMMNHWAAPLLVASKRIAGRGVDPFHWTEHPNPRNTRRLAEMLGRPVASVPDFVAEWARELRTLLPMFKRKNIDRLVNELTPWLQYLMTLDETDAPRGFEDVDREHVNAFGRRPDFVSFVRDHYGKTNASVASVATTTTGHAWVLAAARDAFASRRTCPFDAEFDRSGPRKSRLSRTSRSAMDQHVLNVLVEANRKDDYAFARDMTGRNGHDPWWRVVIDRETGLHENVFFPLAPVAVDLIMNSGLRNTQSTWIDSGEGDENVVDLATATERPNPLPTAMRGRRAGFLRSFELLDGGERRRVLGMFVNTDKTQKAYEVPWIDVQVAGSIERLRDLQVNFNPLERPVPANRVDPDNRYVSIPVPDAFPLFRDPKNPLAQPITADQVRSYWLSLLVHAQPLVNEAIWYEYPLVVDGNARFDIHSLRVTTVTVLIENGVPAEIVQSLVGHASVMMTWYYNAVRDSSVHRQIQLGMERRKAVDGGVGADDELALVDRTAADPVTLRDAEDYAGVDLVRDHLNRGSGIDVFAHGICPGGDCSKGGERLAEGRYAPVWRPRACSRCRFRLTGPAFLNGLVHRLNTLMAEIKMSVAKEQRINDEILETEDAGRPTATLRGNASRERLDRDALFSEWCAELHTVKEAERRIHATEEDGVGSGALVPVGGLDPASMSLKQDEVHDFELFHMLVSETSLMPNALVDLPPGVEERREGWLRQIIRAERLEDYVYSSSESDRRRALDALGDILISRSGGGERLRMLLEGEAKLSDDPAFGDLRSLLADAGHAQRRLLHG